MNKWIRTWLVPGAVFQSVTIGGGYGTGREVVEFISTNGPLGGLFACATIAIIFGILMGFSFDFARKFQVRDYRVFTRELLGPCWVLFEVVMMTGLVVILAICGAAAGEIIEDHLGWPKMIGIGLMLLVIVLLGYLGREWVEKTLTFWSVMVTLMIIAYAIAVFSGSWSQITATIATSEPGDSWLVNAARFATYNCILVPTLLYATQDIEKRTQAWGAGIIAGILTAIPALLYHLTFMSDYPNVIEVALPTYHILQTLSLPVLVGVYLFLLFGTIAQTGAGIIQGISERWDNWWIERFQHPLNAKVHAAISATAVISSLVLANVGIVALVAKGYGALVWISLFIYVIPLFTVGLWKMCKRPAVDAPAMRENTAAAK